MRLVWSGMLRWPPSNPKRVEATAKGDRSASLASSPDPDEEEDDEPPEVPRTVERAHTQKSLKSVFFSCIFPSFK